MTSNCAGTGDSKDAGKSIIMMTTGSGGGAPRYITGLRRKGFVPPLKAAK